MHAESGMAIQEKVKIPLPGVWSYSSMLECLATMHKVSSLILRIFFKKKCFCLGAGNVAPLVACLSSIHKVLRLIPELCKQSVSREFKRSMKQSQNKMQKTKWITMHSAKQCNPISSGREKRKRQTCQALFNSLALSKQTPLGLGQFSSAKISYWHSFGTGVSSYLFIFHS